MKKVMSSLQFKSKRLFRYLLNLISETYYRILYYIVINYEPLVKRQNCPACQTKTSGNDRVVAIISASGAPFLYFQSKISIFLIQVGFFGLLPKLQGFFLQQLSFLGDRIKVPYLSCGRCQSHYQGVGSNRRQPDVLKKFYSKFYRMNNDQFGRVQWLTSPRFLGWRNLILRTVSAEYPYHSRNFLDCGCGEGILGRLLENEGWRTYGVDPSSSMIRFAHKTLDLAPARYISTDYSDETFSPASFDVISSYHVIEHVADPISFLRNIFLHLRANGLAFISTPSATLSETALKCFGSEPNYAPLHLFLLSEEWFKQNACQIGFEIRASGCFPSKNIPGIFSADGEKPSGMWFVMRKPYP